MNIDHEVEKPLEQCQDDNKTRHPKIFISGYVVVDLSYRWRDPSQKESQDIQSFSCK